ncbi:MAG: hypothetical protein HC880_21465 [Bacteroidia bacterium]|nr:hypothetical protein [Bacteroidia bacterium]
MKQFDSSGVRLVEPFVGGGIISLSAAFENLAHEIVMVERDEEVAAVWQTILNDQNAWLADRILHFDLNYENARQVIEKVDKSWEEVAFTTILKNRILHGGILAIILSNCFAW